MLLRPEPIDGELERPKLPEEEPVDRGLEKEPDREPKLLLEEELENELRLEELELELLEEPPRCANEVVIQRITAKAVRIFFIFKLMIRRFGYLLIYKKTKQWQCL